MQQKIILVFIFFSIVISACEKRIDFPLKEASPLLSVDAVIETGQFPRVVLTKSISFFSNVSPEVLSASMVGDATVVISDAVRSVQLKKYEWVLPGNLKFIYYSCDSLDTSTQILGVEGRKYNLSINWGGQNYTSHTTIPVLRKTLDSLWWVKAPNTADTSTKIFLKAIFTDPPEFGDYVRYFTKVNNEPYYPGTTSAFDDLFVNGTTYEIDIPKSANKNLSPELVANVFFQRGDTITVKLSGIDKATYDFWRTTEFSYQSAGNPFSSPVKILGNISNGALGYFGGYSNQFKTIIIPPL